MFRTFIVGIVLGIAGCAVALYYLPIVDQNREYSMTTVAPNGGNTELFHVNVPMDRIMIGAPQQSTPLPVGLEWPQDDKFANTRAELFKIRNAKDAVIGVASRIAANADSDAVIEWVLHLPARGSVYVTMQTDSVEGGYRQGTLRDGTREFDALSGTVSERWVASAVDTAEGETPAGRIELVTAFVGPEEDLE